MMRDVPRFRRPWFIAASLILLVPDPARTAGTAQVTVISPEGVAKPVRQVRAGFSDALVSFGDPKATLEPFEINCPAKGSARWADARNWVFDFDQDLPGGTVCRFKVRAGLKTLDGKPVEEREFVVSTGAPSIKRSRPDESYEGQSIAEDQAFVLELDAPMAPEQAAASLHFVVDGIAERIPARLLSGAELEPIAKALKPDAPFVAVQAQRPFPAEKAVSLVWSPVNWIVPPATVPVETQRLTFKTRPRFTATFNCERENADAQCVPVSPMQLNLSAETPWALASKIRLRSASGKTWSPVDDPREAGTPGRLVQQVKFQGPFPEKEKFTIELPAGFQDDSGRALDNARQFPLAVRTDKMPPLAKFSARFGIVEANPQSALPLTVRNIEKGVLLKLGAQDASLKARVGTVKGSKDSGGARIQALVDWLARVSRSEERGEEVDRRADSVFAEGTRDVSLENLTIPKLKDAKSFEVIGIPLKKPGFYVAEVESRILGSSLLGADKPMYVSTAALVTGLSVHFKRGRESSLAWVTSLEDGKPVAGAKVAVWTCSGKSLASGETGPDGVARLPSIPEKAETSCNAEGRYSEWGSGLYVTADRGDDFSFAHTSWNNGIEPWRFGLPSAEVYGTELVHTVLDRSLLRGGETVHMKHLVRRHGMKGLSAAPRAALPKKLRVEHQGSDEKYELALRWDAQGVATTDWSIPKSAKLGHYEISMQEPGGGWRSSGTFRVENYRVPLMKGRIVPPSEQPIGATQLPLQLAVEHLSGGGAGAIPVKLRYQQHKVDSTEFPDFDGFTFANGEAVKEYEYGEGSAEGQAEVGRLKTQALTLDRNGTAGFSVTGLERMSVPSRLSVELEFRDPNGETQTASNSIRLYPASSLVGIKPDSWFASKKSMKFTLAVVDLKGQPLANQDVSAEFIERKTYSHRKRLVGGFYAYEHQSELKNLGPACSGRTDGHGLLICDTQPPVAGNLIVQARARDASGNVSVANTSTWVYDQDEWWFEQGDHDRMDVLAEKPQYEPGEKAVFQVRMPFREATALVTVEREGVIDSFVTQVSGKKPLIEVPIKPGYAPNAYVSVLAVRGRAGDVQPTALVDLGKPAYKLGIASIRVGWKPHELKVKVTTDQEAYPVRGRAKAKVSVTAADGSSLPAGSEIALAAVDEGLLQLRPNDSWKLLEAMMARRGYEVTTYTAQSQVVGKRHFGLKALPAGGDGGKSPTRELFDTLLLWQARVKLDAQGQAEVEIPLNDSLTSFRIVAVAQAGQDRFGTGSASIRTTQDLMLLAGIPPLVREGDHYPAEITVRNASAKPIQAALTAKLSSKEASLPSQSVDLQPGESKVARWEIDVPSDATSIDFEVQAKERSSGSVLDKVRVTQQVVPAVPVRTYQATLAQLDGELKLDVSQPAGALPERGGIQVTLSSSLAGSLTGVKEYMKLYPYTCLEQKSSRAMALRDRKLWDKAMGELPAYLDRDGLARYFPIDFLEGSDVLTAYLLSIASESGWEIPESPRQRMIQGLKAFVDGSLVRGTGLPTADLTIRKIAAAEALARYGALEAKALTSLDITPKLWPTSAVLDWKGVLERVEDIEGRDAKLAQVETLLRGRLNFQGTTMGFSTEKQDGLWWLMTSADENAARMVLAHLGKADWAQDLPRLMKGALGRLKRGHWDTTPANAWGALAVEKFAAAFESEPVSGSTRATLGAREARASWGGGASDKTVKLGWPSGTAPLALKQEGSGKPWATIQSLAAIPLTQPLSTGYKVRKTWVPVEQKTAGKWSKGDVVRVRLELEAQSDMTWVVVSDPVPAGASILNTGLGNDSGLLAQGEKRAGEAWAAFEERSFEAFRAYYLLAPKGAWTVEYTMRLNQSGKMGLPATRVEAMYAPEMFGELPNDPVSIQD